MFGAVQASQLLLSVLEVNVGNFYLRPAIATILRQDKSDGWHNFSEDLAEVRLANAQRSQGTYSNL